jgi:hypothetical protein
MDVGASAAVKAMEIAITFSPRDYENYKQNNPLQHNHTRCSGYKYAGSFAGRNIELMYTRAEGAGRPAYLEPAVHACFGSQVRHVLICSGFYVLHNLGGNSGDNCGIEAGSCETDGPLGALALVRAFAARGVFVSLFCDPHNGPVIKAGYDTMIKCFQEIDQTVADHLLKYSRCLPFSTDAACSLPTDESERRAFCRTAAELFQKLDHNSGEDPHNSGEDPHNCEEGNQDIPPIDPTSLRCRSLRCVLELVKAMDLAWAPACHGSAAAEDSEAPPPPDCLFAVERLGAPYRNIRGDDIGIHTGTPHRAA